MQNIIKNVSYLSGAAIIVKILGAISAFLIAKYLEPANYGVWISLLLIYAYSGLFTFGVLESLMKLYPFYYGSKDRINANAVEENSFVVILLGSITLTLSGLIFTYFISDNTLKLYVTMMTVTSSIGLISSYNYYRMAAHQFFQAVSILESMRAMGMILIVVPFTYMWSLNGAVRGAIINESLLCMMSLYWNNKKWGKVRIHSNITNVIKLIKIGMPITLFWWTFILQGSIDRILSIRFLGPSETGIYGLGVSIQSLIIMLPAAIGRVISPKINEKAGAGSSSDELMKLVILPARVISVFVPQMIGVIYLSIPIIYCSLLPKYASGMLAGQILVFGAYFIAMIRIGTNYLVAVDKQNKLYKYILLCLICNITLNMLLINYGFGITGLALGSSLSAFLLTTTIWLEVYKLMGMAIHAQIKELFILYLPFILSSVILFIINNVKYVKGDMNTMVLLVNIAIYILLFNITVFHLSAFKTIIIGNYTLRHN